jgi:hypothetical protein
MQLAFDNFYLYAGLQNGTVCMASNKLTGKYGEVNKNQCNLKCKDGSQCGGNMTNSHYRLSYEKNKLCDANIIFNELDIYGDILPNSKGALTNPSGDGQKFIWSFGKVFAESFTLDALRNSYGVV